MVYGEDERERDGGDGDFAESSYDEGACTLFEEFAEVGAQAHSGEGEQEGPAGEVAEGKELRLVEAEDGEAGVR